MSRCRRSKRKAAEAALVAIHKVAKQETASESEHWSCSHVDGLGPSEFTGTIAVLPEDVILGILDYLPKRELVHHASLVSHAWLDASTRPFLWPALEADTWRSVPRGTRTPIFSMARFYQFLSRPQFASLKKLVPPDIRRTMHRNVFDRISASCPHLEEIDLSSCNSLRMNSLVPIEVELFRLPALFPNLKKISLCMRSLNNESVARFVENMGSRLEKLHLFFGAFGRETVCSDGLLEVLGQHCPNLASVRYGFRHGFYRSDLDLVTDEGVIALVRGCPKLSRLELYSTSGIGRRAISFLLESQFVGGRIHRGPLDDRHVAS